MSAFVVGVGASGASAADAVRAGMRAIAAHPLLRVRARSRLYANPPSGGVTQAGFVNAAVVVETALGPAALLLALHAIEHAAGRVRGERNGARALDLDLLWGLDVVVAAAPAAGASMSPSTAVALPHPRVLERAFAVVPALEALARAGQRAPAALVAAGRALALAPLNALDEAPNDSA